MWHDGYTESQLLFTPMLKGLTLHQQKYFDTNIFFVFLDIFKTWLYDLNNHWMKRGVWL